MSVRGAPAPLRRSPGGPARGGALTPLVAVLALASTLAGCRSARGPDGAAAASDTLEAWGIAVVSQSPGVALLEDPGAFGALCQPGAVELCSNGLDDDCDGLLDDGCALPAGSPRWALFWDDPRATLELTVVDPRGARSAPAPLSGCLTLSEGCAESDGCDWGPARVVGCPGGARPGAYLVQVRIVQVDPAALPVTARLAWDGTGVGPGAPHGAVDAPAAPFLQSGHRLLRFERPGAGVEWTQEVRVPMRDAAGRADGDREP